MKRQKIKHNWNKNGFTLIELMVALVVSSILVAGIYDYFITQNYSYTVQQQVIELEQSSRSSLNALRRALRMAGYHAMGSELVNNLSLWVPANWVPSAPAYPITVHLDSNPKITDGGGTNPDIITFLSVLPSRYNPATFAAATAAGDTDIILNLSADETDDQYDVGDIIHIGTTSEYAVVTQISGNQITIDTNPVASGDQGLADAYPAGSGIGEISVVNYTVFNDLNDPNFFYHASGHPELKQMVNGSSFESVGENTSDLQINHLGSGVIEVALSSQTDRRDSKYPKNGGYRTLDRKTKIKIRNADDVAVAINCDVPSAPTNFTPTGLDQTYPCTIHMTWSSATGSTGCPVDGYRVFYGDTPGTYTNSVDVGNVLFYDLVLNATNPMNACTYYVAVAAFNGGGVGPKSTGQITDGVAPTTPTGFTGENVNGCERKVSLSWAPNPECDIYGYNIYRSTALNGPYTNKINSSLISNALSTHSDNTILCCVDCQTYHYKIEAVDYCLTSSGVSAPISVSPTKPEPPTNGIFSSNSGEDTIQWTLSTDDFVLPDGVNNYIKYYNVYGDSTPLTSLPYGSISCTLETPEIPYSVYEVSAVDQCGNESDKLQILTYCTASQIPAVTVTSPVQESTVSGTVTVAGVATPTSGKTIQNVKIMIDGVMQLSTTSSNFTWDWNTRGYSDGNHTLTITALDSIGCSSIPQQINAVVNNDDPNSPMNCAVYACKNSGENNYIYMLVHVYDQYGNPISGATVTVQNNVEFAYGNDKVTVIPETSHSGYYGNNETSDCGTLIITTDNDNPVSDLTIKSKSQYRTDTDITIETTKAGYRTCTCSKTVYN